MVATCRCGYRFLLPQQIEDLRRHGILGLALDDPHRVAEAGLLFELLEHFTLGPGGPQP